MAHKKTSSGFRTIREGIITIVLVLVCFLALMSLLNLMFPTGTGLNLLLGDDPSEAPRRQEERNLMLHRNGSSDSMPANYGWAATLERTVQHVKSKRGQEIAWQQARMGMRLYDEDSLQTLDKASALIRFDADNRIDLGENSLIVIRRMERDPLFREKRSYMVMVDGVLRGRLKASNDNGVFVEITLPNAVTRLQAEPDGGDAVEFRIDVQGDESSSVTIYSGSAEVEANGEAVQLAANQLTRITGESTPSAPISLPKPPTLVTPDPRQRFSYRSLPPRIKLSWAPRAGGNGYHLQLARDAQFSELIVDEQLAQTSFVHGNLSPGDYFWKVSTRTAMAEGEFGNVRRFTLERDQQPPQLELALPEEAKSRELQLTGRTEPDASLYISGQPITLASDGGFRHSVILEPGINVLVVEAVDAAGNVTYRSQLIRATF